MKITYENTVDRWYFLDRYENMNGFLSTFSSNVIKIFEN